MLYTEIIAVCSQIHTKHINTLCGQNVEFVNVQHGGTYSDHWALNIYVFSFPRQGLFTLRSSGIYLCVVLQKETGDKWIMWSYLTCKLHHISRLSYCAILPILRPVLFSSLRLRHHSPNANSTINILTILRF